MTGPDHIRVGIGGWSYDPWRTTFYPSDVAKKSELAYASRQVTAIEINSTFYRLQKPSVFASWRDSTPDNFVFSIKAPRFVVQRKQLAGAGESIERFVGSGIAELGPKLGPVLWQLAATQQFDPTDIEGFMAQLPSRLDALSLRHVMEVRHRSFMTAQFLDIARKYRVSIAFTDDAKYPSFADLTGDFVYARLRNSVASEPNGYPAAAIEQWAQRARLWARGEEPTDLPKVEPIRPQPSEARDVFVYFINGAKERAPAAAMALLERLK